MKNTFTHALGILTVAVALTLGQNTLGQTPGKAKPSAASQKKSATAGQKAPASGKKPGNTVKKAVKQDTIVTASGLKIVMLVKNPKGEIAKNGDNVEVHYTGTLTNGKKFDSSRDRNETFSFPLGKGRVIAGWDEAFSILRKGEKAVIILPPSIGYGSADMGEIPPNSTLIFDVELVDIVPFEPYIPYSGVGRDTLLLPNGLMVIVLDQGKDTFTAKPGQQGYIFYAGYFTDGKKFDGNFNTGEPFKLDIYNAPVIQGWKMLLPLMTKGMKIRAIIPPSLAYGEAGYPGVIPPNATLVFDMYMQNIK